MLLIIIDLSVNENEQLTLGRFFTKLESREFISKIMYDFIFINVTGEKQKRNVLHIA